MKNTIFCLTPMLVFAFFLSNSAQAQAFHKGSFIIGLSEGSTLSSYKTNNSENPHPPKCRHIKGVRDPLKLEYGLSNHWGIGLNMGGDIFMLNPAEMYGTDAVNDATKVTTSEFTLDGSYHFYVTKNTDLSVVGSFGGSSVTIKGGENDHVYQYVANGGIVRLGFQAKYYFWKRLGVQGMWSLYSANTSPDKVKGNTFGNGYSTSISGRALEFGLVFRLGRLNYMAR